MSAELIYTVSRADLRQAVAVRRIFDDIARRQDWRELERLKFCISEGQLEGAQYLPPVAAPLWNCVVQPSLIDDVTPVLSYNYLSTLTRKGDVEYRMLFLDRDPQTGELACLKGTVVASVQGLTADESRRLNTTERQILGLAGQTLGLKHF